MARAIEQIPTSGRVQVEEDTGHHNDLLLQTGLEEVQAVADRAGKTLEVQPQVECAVGHVADVETHLTEAVDHIVPLLTEMCLESYHLLAHETRFQHRHGGLLEGRIGATVQVRTAGADGLDEFLGADDPSDTPSGQSEALGEAVNDEDIVFVDVFNILLYDRVNILVYPIGNSLPNRLLLLVKREVV